MFSLCSMFFVSSLVAQLVSITPKGGGSYTNFNTLSEPTYEDYESGGKIGGAAGLQFDIQIFNNESTRFSPELFFIQNGSKEAFYTQFGSFANDLVNRRVNLDYIGLQLPFEMESLDEMGNGAFFNASFFADFAVNGRTIKDNGDAIPIEFSSEFDKLDLGLSLNLGFVQNYYSIQLGYNYGLKDIEFADEISLSEGGTYLINNKGFTLQIAYIIPTD